MTVDRLAPHHGESIAPSGRWRCAAMGWLLALWRDGLALSLLTLFILGQLLPLVSHLGHSIPSDPIDPLYNVWAVASAIHQAGMIPRDPAALLAANIFYPTPHAAIYGDVFIGLLPLSLPLHLLIANPVALMNMLVILSFALSGYGAYLLGRTLTGSILAALCCAVIFATAPVRYDHAGHLTVQSTEWLIFGVWTLVVAWRTQSYRWWAATGVLLGLAAVTNLYNLAYLSLPAIVVAAAHAGRWTRRRQRGRIFASALMIGIVSPLVIAYLSRHAHLDAGYGAAASTDLLGLFMVFRDRLADALIVPAIPYTPLSGVDPLFPGFIALGLAALSMCRRTAATPSKGVIRPWVVFGACCIVVLLGDHLVIAGRVTPLPFPWSFITRIVHPLAAFRSPSQAAIGMSLALSVLSAYGLTALEQMLRCRIPGNRQRWIIVLIVLLVALESWEQLPTVPIGPVAKGDAWLAHHYPAQPALALPLRSKTPRNWMQQTRMMYDSTASWTPLVNGQASVVPDDMRGTFAILSTYPDVRARQELRQLRIHLVVVYWPWLTPSRRSQVARQCARVYADDLQWICKA